MVLKLKKVLYKFINFFNSLFFILMNRGDTVCCPICQVKLKSFHYIDDLNSICPKCGALSRHRAIALMFRGKLGDSFPKKYISRVLHFAADVSLSKFLSQQVAYYHTADFHHPDQIGSHFDSSRDIEADMTSMPHISSNYYDVVIALDVLEHIANDNLAFSEVYRILSPNGVFCFSVPIQREFTHEYSPGENIGDPDHVRSCGFDYYERAVEHGFDVEIISLELDSIEHLQADLSSSEHHPIMFICKKL